MLKLVVLSCLAAVSVAKPALFAPGLLSPWSAYPGLPLAYSAALPAGPLSLAPGQPASILGADGRPLDTLDVNVARAQHYTAKALEGTGVHLLKKRSLAPLVSAPLATRLAPLQLAYQTPFTYHAPLAYNTPLAYSSPLAYSYAPTLVRTW